MSSQQFISTRLGAELSPHERGLNTSPKCIGYIRVSTGKQDCSLEVQEERIRQYCTANGLQLVDMLHEAPITAKVLLDKRPVGCQLSTYMMATCPARHIVALKLDRLFRNAVDALSHVEDWRRAGISLHLVDLGGQSVNTGSSIGMMLITVLAGFAEFERNIIAERTTAALRHKRSHGEVYNHPPFGYQAKDGKLVPHFEEQLVIAYLLQLRKAGMSYNRIADRLNHEGVVTKRGGKWGPQTVHSILTRDGEDIWGPLAH